MSGAMDTLSALLAFPGAPPFVYLHHPHHPTAAVRPALPARCSAARLDAVELHSARLFYGAALARVADALAVTRRTGIAHDPGGDGREVLTWDGFAKGLRTLWAKHAGKGKARAAADDGGDEGQAVLLITKAERLRGVLGPSWTALARMNELVGVPVTVVLCSQMPWDDLRPARADAPEPLHIYYEAMPRSDVVRLLNASSAHPLYPRFVELLLAAMGNLAPHSPPSDYEYVAAALWPLYTATLPPHAEMGLLGKPLPPGPAPPPLAISNRLLTDLKHQVQLALAAAVESVLTRQVGRGEFVRAMLPLDEAGNPRPVAARRIPRPPALQLPEAARFLLLAAYCASHNPAKSDLRLFGRGTGPDGKKKRGGGTRRAGYGRTRVGRVPQRLLGPKPFALDRLLAVFAALYAEHGRRPPHLDADAYDSEEGEEGGENADGNVFRESRYVTAAQAEAAARRKRDREIEREEDWEDYVDHLAFSVRLWALIPELEGQGLLKRTSPPDRLDNVMLRCEADYDTVRDLAQGLKITLDEYLYEAST